MEGCKLGNKHRGVREGRKRRERAHRGRFVIESGMAWERKCGGKDMHVSGKEDRATKYRKLFTHVICTEHHMYHWSSHIKFATSIFVYIKHTFFKKREKRRRASKNGRKGEYCAQIARLQKTESWPITLSSKIYTAQTFQETPGKCTKWTVLCSSLRLASSHCLGDQALQS